MTLSQHILKRLQEVDYDIVSVETNVGVKIDSREWIERVLIPALDAQGLIVRRGAPIYYGQIYDLPRPH